jgi:hypothetical protein
MVYKVFGKVLKELSRAIVRNQPCPKQALDGLVPQFDVVHDRPRFSATLTAAMHNGSVLSRLIRRSPRKGKNSGSA